LTGFALLVLPGGGTEPRRGCIDLGCDGVPVVVATDLIMPEDAFAGLGAPRPLVPASPNSTGTWPAGTHAAAATAAAWRRWVISLDNFGVTGAKPTHPELLEWLSAEFVRQDGQLKPLLRLLMMSSVYRQASSYQEPPAADVNNDLLWRMRLRRLESEAVRDEL